MVLHNSISIKFKYLINVKFIVYRFLSWKLINTKFSTCSYLVKGLHIQHGLGDIHKRHLLTGGPCLIRLLVLHCNILLVKKATFPCLLFPMYFQCVFSTHEILVV